MHARGAASNPRHRPRERFNGPDLSSATRNTLSTCILLSPSSSFVVRWLMLLKESYFLHINFILRYRQLSSPFRRGRIQV
jgi:hypothetical protein